MTLCLAAVCDSGNSIACVFDQQLTTYTAAADVLSKAARVNERWLLLYAGDDISQVGTVYDRVKRRLLDRRERVTLPEAQGTVSEICNEVMRENLERGPLGLFGYSVPDFAKRSTELVADEHQREALIEAIANARLGADFLLAGFDERDQPHVVTFHDDPDDFAPRNHDRHGFGHVGSGGLVAQHYLMSLGFSRHLPSLSTGYALCASKFMAESAVVGKTTKLSVLKRDGSLWSFKTSAAREIWEEKGRPKIPVGIEDQLTPLKRLWPTPTAPQAAPPATRRVRKSPKHGLKGQRPSRA